MLDEVASFLDRRGKDDLIGRLVLVSDRDVSGEFLSHYFITQALRDGHLVYLVSFSQSFIHYSSVAAKLGVSLPRYQTMGQLVYIDCLTRLLDRIWTGPCSETTPTNPPPTTLTYTLDSNRSLKGLYKALQASIAERNRSKLDRPVCLVFNDLTTLLAVGVCTREIVSFVRYCFDLTTANGATGGGYIVATVHSAGKEEGEEEEEGEGVSEEERVRRFLLHSAHLSLCVHGLESGLSRDVHGEITAEWREPSSSSSSHFATKHAQFKLTDRSVHLFAKGTSKAIL